MNEERVDYEESNPVPCARDHHDTATAGGGGARTRAGVGTTVSRLAPTGTVPSPSDGSTSGKGKPRLLRQAASVITDTLDMRGNSQKKTVHKKFSLKSFTSSRSSPKRPTDPLPDPDPSTTSTPSSSPTPSSHSFSVSSRISKSSGDNNTSNDQTSLPYDHTPNCSSEMSTPSTVMDLRSHPHSLEENSHLRFSADDPDRERPHSCRGRVRGMNPHGMYVSTHSSKLTVPQVRKTKSFEDSNLVSDGSFTPRTKSLTSVNPSSSLDPSLAPIQEYPYLNNHDGSFDGSHILGIHVHNIDRRLKGNKQVVHPVVKIHVIDEETGKYLRKKHLNRNVVSYYENSPNPIETVLPIMTQPCDLVKYIRYPRTPLWEELLLYNEDYDHFVQPGVLIFFEVLDFIAFDSHGSKPPTSSSSNLNPSWWHRICWAFLKVVASDGRINSNKKLRLQLFKPASSRLDPVTSTSLTTGSSPASPQVPASPSPSPTITGLTMNPSTELFTWWQEDRKIPYPATLYVTLKPIPFDQSQVNVRPALRSLLPFQPEQGIDLSRLNSLRIRMGQEPFEVSPTSPNPFHQHHHHHQHHHPHPSPSSPQSQTHHPVFSPLPLEVNVSGHFNYPNQRGREGFRGGRSQVTNQDTDGDFDDSPTHPVVLRTPESPFWSRQAGTACKVPKTPWKEFSAGNNRSCYTLRFSNDGQKLACGASVFAAYLSAEKRSSVFIYELPSGNFFRRVNGFHLGTIYDIDWCYDDRLIMSASNDCTVQVWSVEKGKGVSVTLPHPCFIYSCKFCPQEKRQFLIFTGAFDGIIRIWSVRKSFENHPGLSKDPELLREIDGFQGQVLSLGFKFFPPSPTNPLPEEELVLFSSGSNGSITMWRHRHEPGSVYDTSNWVPTGKIKIPDLKGIPINCIKISPCGSKMLLCCRDGLLRMIDYDLETVVRKYPGSLTFSHLIRGSLSPCGKYIFMGSEDGLVHVWSADTGEKIHTFEDLPFKGPVTCAEYHPYDHVLGICGLGGRTVSVCLFKYSSGIPGEDRLGDGPRIVQDQISGSSPSPVPSSPLPSVPGTSSPKLLTIPAKRRLMLQKSMTVDSNQASGTTPAPNQPGGSRMRKAMRKLEFALKMKSLDQSSQP